MPEKPKQTVRVSFVLVDGAIEAALAGAGITVVVSPGFDEPAAPTATVLRVLRDAGRPLPIGKLATAAGISRDLARVALRELLADRRVRQTGTARATVYSLPRKRPSA